MDWWLSGWVRCYNGGWVSAWRVGGDRLTLEGGGAVWLAAKVGGKVSG